MPGPICPFPSRLQSELYSLMGGDADLKGGPRVDILVVFLLLARLSILVFQFLRYTHCDVGKPSRYAQYARNRNILKGYALVHEYQYGHYFRVSRKYKSPPVLHVGNSAGALWCSGLHGQEQNGGLELALAKSLQIRYVGQKTIYRSVARVTDSLDGRVMVRTGFTWWVTLTFDYNVISALMESDHRLVIAPSTLMTNQLYSINGHSRTRRLDDA